MTAGTRGRRGSQAIGGRGAGGAEARAETAQVPRAASKAGEWRGRGPGWEQGWKAHPISGWGVSGPDLLRGVWTQVEIALTHVKSHTLLLVPVTLTFPGVP